MQTAERRRRKWAIAASVAAHALVLVGALLHRPHLTSPVELATGPAETVIPVIMTPRRAPASRPRHEDEDQSRRPLPSPFIRALPAPSQSLAAQAPAAAAPPGPVQGAERGPDLGLALRHGAAGCANAAAVGMSRAERERCEDQLAAGSKTAPVMALALEPRMRDYYDAVAKAKAPDKALTPQRAIGALGYFDGDPRGVTGHGPSVGCKVPFGAGKAPKLPAHWLKLGPCYIAPPQGPLTVEADITPP